MIPSPLAAQRGVERVLAVCDAQAKEYAGCDGLNISKSSRAADTCQSETVGAHRLKLGRSPCEPHAA